MLLVALALLLALGSPATQARHLRQAAPAADAPGLPPRVMLVRRLPDGDIAVESKSVPVAPGQSRADAVAASVRFFSDKARFPQYDLVQEDQVARAAAAGDEAPASWALSKVSAPAAWAAGKKGAADVKVCVSDSGVNYNHAELLHNYLRTADGKAVGVDYVNGDDDPMDDYGHGTFTAGVVAANADGSGAIGVAWHMGLIACKWLDARGYGYASNAIKCLDWCVRQGATISSNSWYITKADSALKTKLDWAAAQGHLFVAAAGNAGNNCDTKGCWPANYASTTPNVLAVAATDSADALANFSNYGTKNIAIAAPGVSVLGVARLGGTTISSGTSVACPHVAAAAAVALAAVPGQGYARLKQALLDGADVVPGLLTKVAGGRRLDVAATVTALATPTG